MRKTERLFTPAENIRHYLFLLASRGEKTVYRYVLNKEYVSMTYAAFHTLVTRAAAGLSAVGLAGKRVAVIGETSPEWVATYLAVIASGGVIIPMDKELDVTEIEGFLAGVEAEGVVYGKAFNEKFAHARDTHPTLRYFIPTEPDAAKHEKLLPFAKLTEMGADGVESGYVFAERDREAPAVMLFTSGTTGTSKCVVLSEKNLCAAVNAACATVDFFPDDVTLSVLPIHHTYELTIMLASLNYGFTVCINDSLRHLMKNFQEFKPTGMILVPLFVNTIYERIWTEAKKRGKDKMLLTMTTASDGLRKVGIDLRSFLFKDVNAVFGGRLTKIICGGAPLNPEMVKKFESFGIQICEGYGITECSPLIAVNPYYAPKAGSVGPAVPCCEARIAPNGMKNDKGFDEGEIQVRGDNVMIGYYRNDEENAKAFTEDGWYRTGDVGYMDGDGYLYITGRMKSVIVLENGKNVFPEEIEEYLAKIPEIAECVVVGRKAAESGEILLTVVAYPNRDLFAPTAHDSEIHAVIMEKITALNRKLPSFKKIKALELRDTEFEKTTSRKIKRHLVK